MPGTVIQGLQWGDEGKGKIVDYLLSTEGFYAVARFNGGPNAGHTVKVKDTTYRFHQLPSGVLKDNVLNVIGNGCVVDMQQLTEEYAKLFNSGIEPSIVISERAQVILPWHKQEDRLLGELRRANAGLSQKEMGSLTSSTTGRGIGPAYADEASRIGVRIEDLLDEDILGRKLAFLATIKEPYLKILGGKETEDIKELMADLSKLGQFWKESVCDTGSLLNDLLKDSKRVLFEGAQSAHLDRSLGIYPYSTSSVCVASGASSGTGASPKFINEVIGVVKAYTSRSGDGAFPTEIFGPSADKLRELGHEYGTTTNKPRRVGWLDLPMLRTAIEMNGVDWIALTHFDTLARYVESEGLTEALVGEMYQIGDSLTTRFPTMKVLGTARPIYHSVGLNEYVRYIERHLGVPVRLVGTGPERDDIEERPNVQISTTTRDYGSETR